MWMAWLISTPPPLRPARPTDRRRAAEHGAQVAGGEQVDDRLAGGVVAVLVADGDLGGTRLLGRGDEPLRLARDVGDRLLRHHVDPGGQAVESGLDVLVVRGGDVDDVGTACGQQLGVAAEARHVVALRGPGGGVRVGVADRHQLGTGERLDRLEVDDGDVPAPDHGRCCHTRAFPRS